MDVKIVAGEGSEGNEEHVIGKLEGDPRHIVTESLAELCPTVMWKAELVNDKIGRLAEETSKQAVESVAWWLLAAYIKCERKEIN